MFRFTLSLLCMLFIASQSFAQIAWVEGSPYSSKSTVKADFGVLTVQPPSDFEIAEQAEDKIGPYRFGYEHELSLSVTDAGKWTTLANGKRLLTLKVDAPGALSLNYIFDKFHLPQGVVMYIYAPETGHKIGGLNHQNNNKHNVLATAPMAGSSAFIELQVEPGVDVSAIELNLSMVVYGYKDLFKLAKGYGDSGSCNNNVNCPVGDDWRDQQRSVALIVGGGGGCTGALINNTSQNGTPYFLTADHCLGGSVAGWNFVFNWETPGCPNTASAPPMSESVSGASLISNSAGSDFALLELNSTPPSSFNVFYSGWDRSGNTPIRQVGIHHPSGDVKKISFDNDPAIATTWNFPPASVWRVNVWDDGTTEPGSSGSPLYDQNKRIIGQLFGGTAACDNLTDDNYGRFDVSWDGDGTPSTRLSDWLDPSNTGATTLDGFDPNAPVANFDIGLVDISGILDEYCTGGVTIIPRLLVRNNGLDTITEFEVSRQLGSASRNILYTVNLPPSAAAALPLADTLERFNTGVEAYQVDLVTVNGQSSDDISTNNSISKTINVERGSSFRISLTTDDFPDESEWVLRDEFGNVLEAEGPFSQQRTTLEWSYCLPEGCYTFTLLDELGDGLCCNVAGTIELYADNTLIFSDAGNFGSSTSRTFCVTPTGIRDALGFTEFSLYPNPVTNGVFTLSVAPSTTLSYTLVDGIGRMVQQGETTGSKQLNVSDLSPGVYTVLVTDVATGLQGSKPVVIR